MESVSFLLDPQNGKTPPPPPNFGLRGEFGKFPPPPFSCFFFESGGSSPFFFSFAGPRTHAPPFLGPPPRARRIPAVLPFGFPLLPLLPKRVPVKLAIGEARGLKRARARNWAKRVLQGAGEGPRETEAGEFVAESYIVFCL